MCGLLYAWAAKFGLMHMMALYMGPLIFTNVWLVLYTWLQVRISLVSSVISAGILLRPTASAMRAHVPHP